MKKIFSVLMCTLVIVLTANAEDRPIKQADLPTAAQQFIKTHLANRQFSYATKDTDMFDGEYKMVFTDGTKVVFDRRGNWTDVECKRDVNGVPASIIPEPIKQFLAQNHPSEKVIDIEYDRDMRGGYEVKLASKLELKFNKKGVLTYID